jgi:hypothetical protein
MKHSEHGQKKPQGVYVMDPEPVMDPSPLGGEASVLPLGGDSPKEGIANVGRAGFHMFNPVWLLIPRNKLFLLR